MALIQCPECGKDISDAATSCPHCGYPLTPSNDATPIEPVAEPVAAEAVVAAPSKNKKIIPIIIGAVVVVLAIIIAVVVVQNNKAAKTRAEYIDNLSLARTTMLIGAADAESLCNLTKSVWYNTIYEVTSSDTNDYTIQDGKFNDDFNDSISLLYAASSTQETIADIKASQEAVAELIRQLQNPPDDLSACYDALDDLYEIFLDFTALAISPSGSLTTYSANFSDYDNDFMTAYEKLGNIIPEQ